MLLEEYGYDVSTEGGGSNDEVSVWNNKNVSPYPINPVPYYQDSLDWSTDMKDLMRRYRIKDLAGTKLTLHFCVMLRAYPTAFEVDHSFSTIPLCNSYIFQNKKRLG